MRFIQTMSAVATLCAAASATLAQTPPAPDPPAQAASIMRKAYRQAKEAKKPVLLVFGATW